MKLKRECAKMIFIFFAATLAALSFCAVLTAMPEAAYANSAQLYFEGVDATGAVMRGESPIAVEKEILTFDIDEFPETYYTDNEQFFAYGGKVTAQYTFYNPSEYTVTSTLCFPFGKLPAYAPDYLQGSDDATKYGVSVNGERITSKIRHSFKYPSEQFDLDRDLATLQDAYIEDGFFNPDMKVLKCVYQVSKLQYVSDYTRCAAFEIINADGKARVYFPGMNSLTTVGEDIYRVGCWAEEGDKITIYIFGDDLTDDLPTWKFYSNCGMADGDEISGKMDGPSCEVMTLEQFALTGRDDADEISKTDWYNAVVTQLISKNGRDNCPAFTLYGFANELAPYLLRWYEYKFTLAPHERLTNAVTAPVYPTINDDYDPPKYLYSYLLSPAGTWASFGELQIKINTPYHLLERSSFAQNAQKTDDGFELTLDGLPDGELYFELCASENPSTRVSGAAFLYLLLGIAMYVANALGALFNAIGPAQGMLLIALPHLVIAAIDIVGSIIFLIVFAVLQTKKKKAGPPK